MKYVIHASKTMHNSITVYASSLAEAKDLFTEQYDDNWDYWSVGDIDSIDAEQVEVERRVHYVRENLDAFYAGI